MLLSLSLSQNYQTTVFSGCTGCHIIISESSFTDYENNFHRAEREVMGGTRLTCGSSTLSVDYFLEHMEVHFSHVEKHRYIGNHCKGKAFGLCLIIVSIQFIVPLKSFLICAFNWNHFWNRTVCVS